MGTRPWARTNPPPQGRGTGDFCLRVHEEPKASTGTPAWPPKRSPFSTPYAAQKAQGTVGQGAKVYCRPIDHWKDGPPHCGYARSLAAPKAPCASKRGSYQHTSPEDYTPAGYKERGEWHGACPPQRHPVPASTTTPAFTPKGFHTKTECWHGYLCTSPTCRFVHPIGNYYKE